jgi:hypothetical protein
VHARVPCAHCFPWCARVGRWCGVWPALGCPPPFPRPSLVLRRRQIGKLTRAQTSAIRIHRELADAMVLLGSLDVLPSAVPPVGPKGKRREPLGLVRMGLGLGQVVDGSYRCGCCPGFFPALGGGGARGERVICVPCLPLPYAVWVCVSLPGTEWRGLPTKRTLCFSLVFVSRVCAVHVTCVACLRFCVQELFACFTVWLAAVSCANARFPALRFVFRSVDRRPGRVEPCSRREGHMVGPISSRLRDKLMDVVTNSMDRLEAVGLQLSAVLGEASLWQSYFRVRRRVKSPPPSPSLVRLPPWIS